MAENQIITYVNSKMPAVWETKSKSLKIDMETYTKRAILSIYENQQLKKVAEQKDGISKIMMCITNAAMMGLQFGGQFPQVYIVGFNGKNGPEVTLVPTAEGYRHMATQGENPILKEFTVRPVYNGENFSIDYVTCNVMHRYDGQTERGELIGVYAIIEENNGTKRAEFMPRKDIEAIRDTHSKYYITQKKGPWVDDFDQMAIKTAAKRFLKPYAAIKEGREIALAMEEEQEPDIEKRMDDHLDKIIEVEPVQEPEMTAQAEEPEPKEKPKSKKKEGDKNEKKELF